MSKKHLIVGLMVILGGVFVYADNVGDDIAQEIKSYPVSSLHQMEKNKEKHSIYASLWYKIKSIFVSSNVEMKEEIAKKSSFVNKFSAKILLGNSDDDLLAQNDNPIADGSESNTVKDEHYFHYKQMKKDPFQSLIEEERKNMEASKLLNIEDLTLIGIIDDGSKKIAIFQDKDSKGYYLPEGTKVKGGYLKNIGKSKVVFTQRDFDGVHDVVLKFEENK